MEEIKESDTVEEHPQIPIKTYQWEDVRRARNKGGYPWTHLTKPPFDEEADPEMYTMDAYRRSRSSSTLEKTSLQDTSESVDITELHQDANQEELNENRETPMEEKESQLETNRIPKIQIENIIERQSDIAENISSVKNSQNIRAYSEEPSKKRKLSIESSHSRISLSKLAIKDKFKNAKLKIPKFLKRSKSDAHDIGKPKIRKSENKRLNYYQGTSEPVYIHIPLKLPPGVTDEYSKFEFESRPCSRSASLTRLTHFGSGKRKLSLLGLLTELKQLYDEHVVASESRQEQSIDEGTSTLATSSSNSLPEKLKTEERTNKRKHTLKKSSHKSAQEIKELLATSPDASDMTQFLDKDDKYEIITTEIPNLDVDCVIITDYDETSGEATTHSNFSEIPEWNFDLDQDFRPRVRAKSEEPKRKSSIDSGHSRKSLSKLAFMKKVKDVKDSIKLPKFLSFNKLDDKDLKPVLTNQKKPNVQGQSELSKKQPQSPVYIHIPLKLSDGQKDDSSHLTKIDTQNKQGTIDPTETPKCETPISPDSAGNDVQLIFLTPPSDDEILDPNIPETPSESDKKFFEGLKVDELKTIAKGAVDMIYPDHKKLEVVIEDDKIEEDSQRGVQIEGGTTYWQMHPVLVDEEDGLKLSDAAIAMINEEMAKEVHVENEESKRASHIKKKVSFKKSRALDGERIYEDVGLSPEPNKEGKSATLETFRSMSADEEKSYLDEKVIKTTSLDEDYNKWSKITDHEYEPVNPPLNEMQLSDTEVEVNLTPNTTNEYPKHITFSEKLPSSIISGHSIETHSVQDAQDDIEERYFKAKENVPKQGSPSHQTEPSGREIKKKEKNPQKRSTGKSFTEAITTQADKIKNKLQRIKKPTIHLPQAPKFPTAAFSKMKFKKPTFNVPKMPEMPSLKLASLSLPRKDSKSSWRKRQYSTESNAGDSKTKKFDFRTYPRIFEKSKVLKQTSLDFEKTTQPPVFATVPRIGRTKAPQEPELEYVETEKDDKLKEYYYDKTRGFVTIPIDRDIDNALHAPSHIRYNQDINIDDGFNGEEGDVDLREISLNTKATPEWKKEDTNQGHRKRATNGDTGEFQSDQSSPSLSEHRQGVLEEIDSDQFFLREKGISQDDIDVGKYLSSEIKEAFRNPINALTQLQSEDREYDVDITDQSQSSEEMPKRKWLKKPKRKKTPHVSNEQLSFEFGSDPEEYVVKHNLESTVPIPTRPKRRSKKSKKKKPDSENIIPYQETIPTEPLDFMDDELESCEATRYMERSDKYKETENDKDAKSQNELYVNTYDKDIEIFPLYKNTHDEDIAIFPMYKSTHDEVIEAFPMYKNIHDEDLEIFPIYKNIYNEDQEIFPGYANTWQSPDPNWKPTRPVRKNKSMKSLNATESNGDRKTSVERGTNSFEEIPITEEICIKNTPPCRPNRKRSHTRSESVTSLREKKSIVCDTPPIKPLRFRSQTRSESVPSLQDKEVTPTKTPPIRPNRIRSHTRSQSTESLPGSRGLGSLQDLGSRNLGSRDRSPQDFASHGHSPKDFGSRDFGLRDCSPHDLGSHEHSPKDFGSQDLGSWDRGPQDLGSHGHSPRDFGSRDLDSRDHSPRNLSSRDLGSRDDSPLKNSVEIVCVEEPCIQIICDRMGYAIVDKTKIRDPPLPPSRFPKTPPRTRRKKQTIKNDKSATVPRPPQRPLRNYSTLNTAILHSTSNGNIFDDGNKENTDVNPYIEIDEDEIARRLQSGDVIQKMRERPLPAPPRPPRKARTPNREVFRDISHERNLPSRNDTLDSKHSGRTDFTSELSDAQLLEMEQQILTDDHEETITHAALVVQPLGRSPAVSHSELFNTQTDSSRPSLTERIVSIEREQVPTDPDLESENLATSTDNIPEEQLVKSFISTVDKVPVVLPNSREEEDSDEEGMSEIPEEFYKLKQLEAAPEVLEDEEVPDLKLQLLDIDELIVNELSTSKAVVSALEGEDMNVSDNLVPSEDELPQNVLQEMIDPLHPTSLQQNTDFQNSRQIDKNDVEDTPIIVDETEPPPVPPRSDSVGNLVDAIESPLELEETTHFTDETAPELLENDTQIKGTLDSVPNESPVRPPRRSSQVEKQKKGVHLADAEKYGDTEHNDVQNNSKLLENNNSEQTSPEPHCFKQTIPESSLPEHSNRDLRYSPFLPTQESQESSNPEPPYVSSQPPFTFYHLASPLSDAFDDSNIPLAQCRMCRRKLTTLSRSSSSEELSPRQRRPRRLSEPSIPELTGQLVQSCSVEIDRSLRNIITYISDNFLRNAEGKKDLQVMLLMLVILIASLILMNGDGKIQHHHHWDYFNPPREF